jgi:hypothetical protein
VVTSGTLAHFSIVDSLKQDITTDTLNNDGTTPLLLYTRGYDAYWNELPGVQGTWSTTGAIPGIPPNVANPSNALIYNPVNAVGEQGGYILVQDGATNLKDSVRVYILDVLQSRIAQATTRDTNGNGYLDKLEIELSEAASFAGVTGIAGAFQITDASNRTWTPVSISPIGVRTNKFIITLAEHNPGADVPLETDALPNVKFLTWTEADGITPQTISAITVDGAGPVIKSVVIDDRSTTDPLDDEVIISWSERVTPNRVYNDANEVFDVFYPDSAQSHFSLNYLLACPVEVLAEQGKVNMKNGAVITDLHWFKIDSASAALSDLKGNLVLSCNRKVKPEYAHPPTVVTLTMEPNPLPLPGLMDGTVTPKFKTVLFDYSRINILIYDLAGNLVRKLGPLDLAGVTDSGSRGRTHIITWDGKNGKGRFVSRGGYVAKLYCTPKQGNTKTQKAFFKIAVQ